MTRASFAVLVGLTLLGCKQRSESDDASPSSTSPSGSVSDVSSPFDPERPPDRLALPQERAAPGAWAKSDDYRMRVVAVRACEVEPHFAPQKGHLKLGVELEMAGTSKHEVPSNPLHATLVDAEGNEYPATLAGCLPSLPAKRIKESETTRGFVTFEVPENAGALVLRYAPFVIGRADATLAFDVER